MKNDKALDNGQSRVAATVNQEMSRCPSGASQK